MGCFNTKEKDNVIPIIERSPPTSATSFRSTATCQSTRTLLGYLRNTYGPNESGQIVRLDSMRSPQGSINADPSMTVVTSLELYTFPQELLTPAPSFRQKSSSHISSLPLPGQYSPPVSPPRVRTRRILRRPSPLELSSIIQSPLHSEAHSSDAET